MEHLPKKGRERGKQGRGDKEREGDGMPWAGREVKVTWDRGLGASSSGGRERAGRQAGSSGRGRGRRGREGAMIQRETLKREKLHKSL